MSKRLIASIFGALAVSLIAGCGSSGDSSTSSLTKAEFIKRGDAICGKVKSQLEAELQAAYKKSAKAENLAKVIKSSAPPAYNAMIEELQDLGIPAGDEEQINAILDETTKGVEEIESADSKLGSGRLPAIERANKLAAEYGFTLCIQN